MKAGCIAFANETVNGNGNLYLSESSCGSCGMRQGQVRVKSNESKFQLQRVCDLKTFPTLQNLFVGENCPNTGNDYDKVFVEEEDCFAQCGSENCGPLSDGGLVFTSWNDGSSCGMQEGQEVWVGCNNDIYVVLDDCEKQCDPNSCLTNTSIYFVSQCISCLSAGGGASGRFG